MVPEKPCMSYASNRYNKITTATVRLFLVEEQDRYYGCAKG